MAQQKTSSRGTGSIISAFMLATLAIPSGAQAAPQVLGLIAMLEPMEMQCDRQTCVAELNTFCLEKERAAPTKGAEYRVAAGQGITLTGTLADGRTLNVEAKSLTLKAHRGHTTVLASIPAALLKEQGIASISVTVGLKTALVPETTVADPNPHSAVEIAKAIGPLRLLGSQIVDADVASTLAADFANRVINRLPMTERLSEQEREGVWQATHGKRPSSPALEQTKGVYDQCRRQVYLGNQKTLRSCLSRHRDFWLNQKTLEYWSSAAGI